MSSRKLGRTFAHELTDSGWAWCRRELSAVRPVRAGYGGGALYVVLVAFERYLDRVDLQLSDVFQAGIEAQIRSAYLEIGVRTGQWVGLADLRERLTGVPRPAVDAELERMASTPGVHVQAEPNQKALSDADRVAAVRFGGDDRHMLMIEAG